MNELTKFIRRNYIFVILLIILLLVINKFKNVLTENLETLQLNSTNSFCESYLGNSSELEKACNELTKGNCSKLSCCIYSENKCVAGDSRYGPTYKKNRLSYIM
jgi:hypothetical protein